MNKVFADTYWLMWGVWSGDKPRLIERVWLTSILPPFYRGVGIQIRIGEKSLRIGVCHPRMPVTVDPYTYIDDLEANVEALAGYAMDETNKEIRSWGSSPASQPTSDTEQSSDASSPS